MGSLTLVPTKVPEHYFSQENVDYISEQVTNILTNDFQVSIVIDDESIRKVLHRILDDRLEPLQKMLERVIMEITNEVKTFELERLKNLRLEQYYTFSQKIYDIAARSGPDMQSIKISRQPATLRFYHTFGT